MNSINQISNKYNQPIINNEDLNKSIISPFIVEGEFLEKRPSINSKYSLRNFKYLTNSDNNVIVIGKGGYGKLYLSKNVIDNNEYAIKNISKKKMKEVGVDTSIIKREIDVHIRITHPHIIKLFSFCEDRHNFYLAMEYAQKGNLYQLIQKKKGMEETEAFHYFIQVVSAIHFLHINGYAHRDIKPENILLDKNGQVKLCDFGWCVNVSKGERITFCGTYEYMAPEMINDELYDMGIDIWSLGVLLYEMIHGYSPFRAHYFLKDAKSAMKEIFMNIKNNNYVIERNISEECVDLIDKLLTIDQKKRIKINEIFLHPWVVNKEKKYFPFFQRIKIDKYNDENNIDEDINEDIYIKIDNNINNNYLKDNNLKNNVNIKNKNNNYYYSYSKCNSSNNGFHFIKEKNKENIIKNINNKFNKEELIKKINDEKYKIKDKQDFATQRLDQKNDDISQNNFVYSINNSKEKKSENPIINTLRALKRKSNLSEIKLNKNNDFQINITNIHDMKKNCYNLKNIYLERNDKKPKNIEINKENDIEENKFDINIIKKIRKEYESNKNINNEQLSFIYNKPKKDISPSIVKNFSKGKIINQMNPEILNREQRSRSLEKSLNKNNINFSGNNILKIKYKEEEDIQIQNTKEKNINEGKKINNYIQIKNLNSDEIKSTNSNDFHRFRKKVVHIKKSSFLHQNNFKIIKTKEKIKDDKIYDQLSTVREQKPVQNIFYNTYYNCQFDNIENNSINFNINQSGNHTNNFYFSINNDIRNRYPIKKSNTDFNHNLKSFSNPKNDYKNKEEINDKNKVKDLINFCTENQIGKIYTNRFNIIKSENFENRNNKRYIITKSEQKKYINTRKISPYKKRKEVLFSSYN